jgi:hypothetical protein
VIDLYAQERENLIEGDPVAVVDELLELRELKVRVERLADAYEANAVMLAGKILVEDGLLHIMSLCSASAARLIRGTLEG